MLQDVTSSSTAENVAQANTTDVEQLAESIAGCSTTSSPQRGYRTIDRHWLSVAAKKKKWVPAGFLGASVGVGTTRSPT